MSSSELVCWKQLLAAAAAAGERKRWALFTFKAMRIYNNERKADQIYGEFCVTCWLVWHYETPFQIIQRASWFKASFITLHCLHVISTETSGMTSGETWNIDGIIYSFAFMLSSLLTIIVWCNAISGKNVTLHFTLNCEQDPEKLLHLGQLLTHYWRFRQW